jgi:outer membrane receptor for ferrienterochelin and colicin
VVVLLYEAQDACGTVNVITKKNSKRDSFELEFIYQNMNGKGDDYSLNGNTSFVSRKS